MSEERFNPNDPAFLASRSLDERLSPGEQAVLDEALASSESLRAEVGKLGALKQLIQGWGADDVEVDCENYQTLIHARAHSEEYSEDLDKVDQLLSRWGRKDPCLDADVFTASVMARIHRIEGGRWSRRLIVRVGVPLAAAAALLFVLTGGPWLLPAGRPVCRVVYGAAVGSSGAPRGLKPAAQGEEHAAPTSVVVFDRTALASAAHSGDRVAISLGVVGSGPLAAWPELGFP